MEVAVIIAAAILIVGCIIITAAVLLQETSSGDVSSAITGSSGDNYYERTKGNSKEAKLRRLTAILIGVFMAITLGVNLFAVHYKAPVPEINMNGDDLISFGTTEAGGTTAADGAATAEPGTTTDDVEDTTKKPARQAKTTTAAEQE
ncbi:hypothetical protein FACS1894133_3870 [Clostridia bacterium]|nr:hypothetical protein FACS1894133_3870 [Clostridia bacterium]